MNYVLVTKVNGILNRKGGRCNGFPNNTNKLLGCCHRSPCSDDYDTITENDDKDTEKYVPTIALALGLLISVFISHRHSLVAGLFMGWFYGYSAIGSYASMKTTILTFLEKRKKKEGK